MRTRARKLALLGAGLAAALAPASTAATADQPPETYTLKPAMTQDAGTTTTSSFDSSVRTVITVSGVITATWSDGSVHQYDPIYGFSESPPSCCNELQANMPGTGFNNPIPFMYFVEPIGERNPRYPQNPAYDPVHHTYRLHFTASEKGPMTFFAPPAGSPQRDVTYAGSFTVKVEREADDQSLWEVPFKFRQRGEPAQGAGQGEDFVAAETVGSGKLIFTRKPKNGSAGSVAAHLTHSDDFVSAIGLATYGQTATLVPRKLADGGAPEGDYATRGAGRGVKFRFRVAKVSSDGTRRVSNPLEVGDEGIIALADDKDVNDRVTIVFYNRHRHTSTTTRKDTVKVTVGKPRKVGG